MKNLFTQINGLITKWEVRTLRRAAKILNISDRHDRLFFEFCKEELHHASKDDNIVVLGSEFALVRTSKPAVTTTAQITDLGA